MQHTQAYLTKLSILHYSSHLKYLKYITKHESKKLNNFIQFITDRKETTANDKDTYNRLQELHEYYC